MTRQDLDKKDKDPKDIEREVRKRVKKLRDFYSILAIFAVLAVLVIVINLLTSPGTFWAIWPLLGLGTALALVAITSGIVPFGIGSKSWEDRKVRELLLRQQRGLSAERVRQLLREELHREQHDAQSPAEWDRMRARLEHLEAIVTSQDWDEVAGVSAPDATLSPDIAVEEERETSDDVQRAARLARRVR